MRAIGRWQIEGKEAIEKLQAGEHRRRVQKQKEAVGMISRHNPMLHVIRASGQTQLN
jgi:hypothetical protein